MRVLLVNPPLLPAREVAPPLSLCTLAAWLLPRGHEAKILDLDLEVKLHGGDPRSFFRHCFLEELERYRPNVIGVTSMYNNSLQAEQLVRLCKRASPETWTVAGGCHFGALGVEALARIEELDFVVEGEGEVGLSGLLDALSSGASLSDVPNLCHRRGGGIARNKRGPLLELGALPSIWEALGPAVDLERYRDARPVQGRRGACVEAGRGCPYACTFCAPAIFWQQRYRVKPVERLVGEMRFLNERLGYDSFLLVHDLLTADKRYVAALSEALLAADLPVEWLANSRTDLDLRPLLPTMRKAGCWKLFFGVESASARIQKAIDKHLCAEDAVTTIAALAAHGIDATCSFVIGFPDETAAEVASSIRLGVRLKLTGAETVQFHRLRLFPPARMLATPVDTDFDLESLRMEYPFAEVAAEDLEAIRSAPGFFTGYFAPRTAAAAADEVAQIELFFQQAVAIAPLSVGVVAEALGNRLIPSFQRVLRARGHIDRYALDPATVDLRHNWTVIRAHLCDLADDPAVMSWQRRLFEGVMRYEETRLRVVVSQDWSIEGALSSFDGGVIFEVPVDVFHTLRRLAAGAALDSDLLGTHRILFGRDERGVVAYDVGTPAMAS